MSQSAKLKRLIEQDDIVMAPGAPDVLTARLVEKMGFPAVYMTGFGATATRLGMPDIGLLTQTEMSEHARNMTRATTIPVIADADTGYGGLSNLQRTVREYIQAGVAAIHLEDQIAPKRCGQMTGIKLVDATENARRLKCAIDARGQDDLLIIGRTDALPAAGMDEAIHRAHLYQDAGVDLVFVDGIKTIAEVEAVAKSITGPKIVSLVDGTPAEALTAADLQEMGFSIVFYAVSTLFAVTKTIENTLLNLQKTKSIENGPARHSYAEFSDIVRLKEHNDLDDLFGLD